MYVLSKNPYIKVYTESLDLVQMIKVPGFTICKMILPNSNVVLGFNANDCILYDYDKGCEVIRCDTKGGARSMACT